MWVTNAVATSSSKSNPDLKTATMEDTEESIEELFKRKSGKEFWGEISNRIDENKQKGLGYYKQLPKPSLHLMKEGEQNRMVTASYSSLAGVLDRKAK